MIVQKKYKVSSQHSDIEITYTAGVLSDIKINHADDEADFLNILKIAFKNDFNNVENYKVKELKVNNQKQNIALWCSLYKMQYGNDYKVTQREAGMLKGIELTPELINTFFNSSEWWAKEKTIARITSNYNELKRIGGNKQQSSARGNSKTQTDFNSLADEFRRRYS
ncbi:MAG: hypothetical protein L3J56_06340 [Bacteroidales bacterium]|nr:hypothetical protein [Bacteroidales bacterium]